MLSNVPKQTAQALLRRYYHAYGEGRAEAICAVPPNLCGD